MSMPECVTRFSNASDRSSPDTYRGIRNHQPALHSTVPGNGANHYSWSNFQEVNAVTHTSHIYSTGSETDESLILEEKRDGILPSISISSPSEDQDVLRNELGSTPLRRTSTLKTHRMQGAPEKGHQLRHPHDPFLSNRTSIRITSAPVVSPAVESLFDTPEHYSSNDSLFSVESTESSHIEPGRSMASLLSQYRKLPCESQMLDNMLQCEEITSIYEDDENLISAKNDSMGLAKLNAHHSAIKSSLTDLGSVFTPSSHFDDDNMSVASLFSVSCEVSRPSLASADHEKFQSLPPYKQHDYHDLKCPVTELHKSIPQSVDDIWRDPKLVQAPSSPLEQLCMANLMNSPAETIEPSATGDYYINDESTGMPLRVSKLIVRTNRPINLQKADSATASITTDAFKGLGSSGARIVSHTANNLVSLASKFLASLSKQQWSDCSSKSMEEKRLSVCVDLGEHYSDSRFKIDDYTLGRGHDTSLSNARVI